jgi:hypothetical protein
LHYECGSGQQKGIKVQKIAGKFIVVLIFPPIVFLTILVRLWLEVKSVPFLVWCDVKGEWDSFMGAMKA